MARLPRISKPRIPKPLTSPSAAYGLPQATGSPSAFYGGGQAAPQPGGAPAFGSTGAGMGASLGAGAGPTGSTLPRIGGTLGGVPMVRTQQQPDPYAALSDAELRARTLAQISATYDPLIAQITSSYEQRAAAGGQAIKGITDQLVQQMRGYQGSAANIYGQAQQSQAASDAALSSMLSGQGTQLASELGSRLASINAPAATQGAQQAVTQAGAGSAGALYGKGSASQSDLIARGAGAQEYAAKLPGISGLAGLQQLGAFQGQISGAEQDELGRLRAQIPGATADLLNSLRATEMQKAGARTDQQRYDQSRADTLAGQKVAQQQYGQSRADRLAGQKAAQQSSAASLAERRREFGIQQQGAQATAQAKQVAAQAKVVQTALARQDAQDKRLSQETGFVYVNGRLARAQGKPISTVDAQKLAQQGTIAAARLQQTGALEQAKLQQSQAKLQQTGALEQAKLQQTGSLAQAKLTQQQQASQQRAKEARVRSIISEGIDPTTGQLTPKARASLSSALGFDPITGKPTARTQVAATNAKTAAARASESARHNQATERARAQQLNVEGQKLGIQQAGLKLRALDSDRAWQKHLDDLGVKKADLRIKATGLEWKMQQKHTSGGFTASQRQKLAADAADSARDAYYGVPDNVVKTVEGGQVVAKNAPIPQRSYTEAYKDLVAHGIPPSIAERALNRYYTKTGKRGRPMTSLQRAKAAGFNDVLVTRPK